MPTCDFCNASVPVGSNACPKCGAALRQEYTADAGATAATGTEDDVGSLVRQGRKIEAIKVYRAQTGVGLAEAKAAVEAIARKHGIEMKSAGCASMILVGLAPVMGIVAWLCR